MARILSKTNNGEKIMTFFEKFKREKALIAECEKYLKENRIDKFNETVIKIKKVENEYINLNNKEEKKCQ